MYTSLDKMYSPHEIITMGNAVEFSKHDEIKQKAQNIKLVRGHMFFGVHKYVRSPFRYITLLRDPVERVVSFFYFMKNNKGNYLYDVINDNDMSLDVFIDNNIAAESSNLQAWMLSGVDGKPRDKDHFGQWLSDAKANIDKMFTFGLSEEFDLSLELFKKELGLPYIPVYGTVNITVGKPKDIPKSTIEKIKKVNELDIELYEFAKDRFYKKVHELGLS